MTDRESSSSSNVIALIVVIFLLVIVGYYTVAPGHGPEPARATAEAASRPAAGAPAKPARPMENTSAARAPRGLLNASRAGVPIKR